LLPSATASTSTSPFLPASPACPTRCRLLSLLSRRHLANLSSLLSQNAQSQWLRDEGTMSMPRFVQPHLTSARKLSANRIACAHASSPRQAPGQRIES
jgi:hypothetical protein